MTAIRLDSATIGQRARPLLSNVTLTIARGEFIGLLGPNGAGKTTLLHALLGLLPPLAGRIELFGRPARPGTTPIGYLPQTHAAAPHIAARDLLALAATGHRWGLPRTTRATSQAVDRVLDLVDATPLARRPLDELSGGERQRLLLAQALLGDPEILLLDEPLLSLDPGHQQSVVALVDRLRTQLRLTVLFSAHDLNPLLGAIDRVLYVGAGQAAIGTVDEVVTGPVLSRLYGAGIEVVRAQGRIFVLLDGADTARFMHAPEPAFVRV